MKLKAEQQLTAKPVLKKGKQQEVEQAPPTPEPEPLIIVETPPLYSPKTAKPSMRLQQKLDHKQASVIFDIM